MLAFTELLQNQNLDWNSLIFFFLVEGREEKEDWGMDLFRIYY